MLDFRRGDFGWKNNTGFLKEKRGS